VHSSTTFYCVFTVSGRAVQVKADEPVHITDGDDVAIAGSEKSGVFKGLAYRNFTNGARGGMTWWHYLIPAGFLGAGVVACTVVAVSASVPVVLLGVLPCGAAAAFCYRYALRIRRAKVQLAALQ
jgi:hypothetical protein